MCCLTGQYHSAKKRLVQLAVLSGWHYQTNQILLKFYFEKLVKVIQKKVPVWFFFFCDNTLFLPPPPPFLSILKLWFSFNLGLHFIFFCFKLIIIHYHTQKPTLLGSMGNCLSRKAEMPTSVVDFEDSLFFTFPLYPTVNSPNTPTTGRRSKSSKQDPRVALCCSLVFI